MNRIKRPQSALVFIFCLLLGGGHGFAQSDQPAPKNLKFFPRDTPRSELIARMRNFSFALGAPCTHCHGTEEQTTPDLTGVDFSTDLKPTKDKARAMLRMTQEINQRLLANISPRSELQLEVTCFTCHSGIPLPEPIEARVLRMIESRGIEAAEEDYRATRRRYYGTAAYNFRLQPLVEVASQLQREDKYREAAEICLLGLEFYPDAGPIKFQLAEIYVALGEKEEAAALYEELSAISAYSKRAQDLLEALRKP